MNLKLIALLDLPHMDYPGSSLEILVERSFRASNSLLKKKDKESWEEYSWFQYS